MSELKPMLEQCPFCVRVFKREGQRRVSMAGHIYYDHSAAAQGMIQSVLAVIGAHTDKLDEMRA